MAKLLQIQVEVPEDLSEESLRLAQSKAREAAILELQQQGELSIREAAATLGLTYEGYLELLTERRLPATNTDTDPAVLELFRGAVAPE